MNDVPEREMPFAAALRDFFAPPTVTVAEMKALNPADRKELRSLLTELGYRILPPKGQAA